MRPAANAENALLLQLLKLEAGARQAATEVELGFLIANETMRVVRARQIFVVALKQVSDGYRVTAASSLTVVDRNAPLIQWVGAMVAKLGATDGVAKPCEFVLPAYCDPTDPSTRSYPFVNFMWVPLWSRHGTPTHGMLLARDVPWIEADRRLTERLGMTYGHALAQLHGSGDGLALHKRLSSRPKLIAAAMGLSLLGFFPMSISALAPVEVTARNAGIVAMPVDAIVQEVLVKPNEPVKAGQPLVRLNNTIVRNQLKLAEREVVVAKARVQQSNSLAFTEAKGRHDLGIAQAELELKIAELEYARDLVGQFSVTARTAGIAVFSDRKDLEGKPFRTGDRLMQVAVPGELELEIELPVADFDRLAEGRTVARVPRTSSPLSAIAGTVAHIDYRARLSKTNVASYRIVGSFDEVPADTPRLGTRGTAQVYGPAGTLGLYLFRRPLSAIRQRFAL